MIERALIRLNEVGIAVVLDKCAQMHADHVGFKLIEVLLKTLETGDAGLQLCTSTPLFERLIEWGSSTAECDKLLTSATLKLLVTMACAGLLALSLFSAHVYYIKH